MVAAGWIVGALYLVAVVAAGALVEVLMLRRELRRLDQRVRNLEAHVW